MPLEIKTVDRPKTVKFGDLKPLDVFRYGEEEEAELYLKAQTFLTDERTTNAVSLEDGILASFADTEEVFPVRGATLLVEPEWT